MGSTLSPLSGIQLDRFDSDELQYFGPDAADFNLAFVQVAFLQLIFRVCPSLKLAIEQPTGSWGYKLPFFKALIQELGLFLAWMVVIGYMEKSVLTMVFDALMWSDCVGFDISSISRLSLKHLLSFRIFVLRNVCKTFYDIYFAILGPRLFAFVCTGNQLRFVVLTYMGCWAHDLVKPTHLLTNMRRSGGRREWDRAEACEIIVPYYTCGTSFIFNDLHVFLLNETWLELYPEGSLPCPPYCVFISKSLLFFTCVIILYISVNIRSHWWLYKIE